MLPTLDPGQGQEKPNPPPAPRRAARYFTFRGDVENFDADAVRVADETLHEYREKFRAEADKEYPFRLVPARHAELPAKLNGYLNPEVVMKNLEDAPKVAEAWLEQDITSRALYGLDWGQVASRELLRLSRVRRLQNDKEQWSAHVHFQEYLKELPVYGGEVVVHLTTGTRCMAVSASYFPIKPDAPLARPPTEEDAIPRALRAARRKFLDTLSPTDAVDLYWDELAHWLEVDGALDWSAEELALLERLVIGLRANGLLTDPNFVAQILVDRASGAGLERLRDLARKTRRGPAHLVIAPYAGSKLFVFPFAGRFYHAYCIEYVPTLGTPWRLFVDAQNGMPLGEPEALALFNQIFPSVTTVPGHPGNTAGSPQNFNFTAADVTLVNNFAHIFDKNCAAVNFGAANLETSNVIFHTREMRNFFVGLANPAEPVVVDSFEKAPGVSIAPGLEINVGLERTGLAMGFMFFNRAITPPGIELELGGVLTAAIDPCVGTNDPADSTRSLRLERKLLQFQTDPGGGLATVDRRIVFTPSLDPEVIYHEVAHACMWIVNRSPFEQSNVNVPFWRALTEGYADYFARSFAARSEPAATVATSQNHWAAAAFRNFGDERALSRHTSVEGEDLLAIANMYPEDQVQGAGVYRVGMIWARALWEIRAFFSVARNGTGPCTIDFSTRGAADVDRWALHAFDAMVGWVTNFETAAEAFINEAQRTSQASVCEIEEIKTIFIKHGIYAERGMQAVAQGNNAIVVGADLGVRRFVSAATPPWADAALKDVVALIFSNPNTQPVVLYAATENGVFKHVNFPNNTWQPVGAWTAGEMPVCMTLEDRFLLVGTAHGVYFCDPANPQWEAWNPAPGPRNAFGGLAFNLTTGELRGNDNHRYRVCFVADLSDPDALLVKGVKLNILTQNPLLADPPPKMGQYHPLASRNGWVNVPTVPNLIKNVNGVSRIFSGRPTAVALAVPIADPSPLTRRTNLYIGTLGRGVWRQENIVHERNSGLVIGNLDPMPNNLPEGLAVLCLVLDTVGGHKRLLAGTNDGAFEHDLSQSNSGWQPLAGLPQRTMIRQIAPTAGEPLLATYNQGLLFKTGGVWTPFRLE